ncbi:MAG: type II secretion system protein GspL [Cellvibrionaceae bacterium]
MAEKLIIQLLQEFSEEEGAVVRHFRWGYVDELSDWPEDAALGSDEDLLMALDSTSQAAVLLIPGNKVVSLPVAYDKKEARHFAKLLPYQIEDDVLGSVDDLHFAISNEKSSEVISVAYTDKDWLFNLLEWFSTNNITIEHCITDFQCLKAINNELLLWFVDDGLLGHRANGLGFSISQPMSQPFLKDMLLNQQDIEDPWQVRIYVDDAETKEIIESHIMPPVEYDVVIGHPPLDFSQENHLNFCSGKYGKKLPVQQWWQEAKPVALLAAAAVAVFFVASFADIYLIKQQQAKYQQEITTAYREVIPRGPLTDPVRRLKSVLGSGATSAQSSQSVFLLSKVAPVMDKLKIDLTTLNYNHREQTLRINIKADSFNGIEQFRQQLEQQGVTAELQNSSAANEGFQARLRIGLKGARNG